MAIQAGDCVELFGLTSDAGKLCNGREGIVTQWDDTSERWVVRLHASRKSSDDRTSCKQVIDTVMKVRANNLMLKLAACLEDLKLTESLDDLVLDKSLRSWNRLTFPDSAASPGFCMQPFLKWLEPYEGQTEHPVEIPNDKGGWMLGEYEQVFYPGGYQVVLQESRSDDNFPSKEDSGSMHMPRVLYVLGRCTYSVSDRAEFSIMMRRKPTDKAPWPTSLAVMSCPRCAKTPKPSNSGQEYVLVRQPLSTVAEVGFVLRFVPRLFCMPCYQATLEGQHLSLPQGWVRTRQETGALPEAYCHMPANDPLFVALPSKPESNTMQGYQIDAALVTGVGPAKPAWDLDEKMMFSGRSESLSTGFVAEITRTMGGKMKSQDTDWSKKDGVTFGKLGTKNSTFGVLARCSNPGCDWRWHMSSDTQLKRCAGCECAAYCSPACQKAHWKQHKAHCKTAAKASRHR